MNDYLREVRSLVAIAFASQRQSKVNEKVELREKHSSVLKTPARLSSCVPMRMQLLLPPSLIACAAVLLKEHAVDI